jgi:hypothetical protein
MLIVSYKEEAVSQDTRPSEVHGANNTRTTMLCIPQKYFS